MAANTAVVSRSLDLTSNWKMQNAKMVQILNTVTDRYHRSTRLQGPRPPLGKRHYKTRKKDIFSTSCFLLPTSKRQGTSRSGTGSCTRYNSVFRLQNRVWPSLPRANRQQHSQTWSPALGIKICPYKPCERNWTLWSWKVAHRKQGRELQEAISELLGKIFTFNQIERDRTFYRICLDLAYNWSQVLE